MRKRSRFYQAVTESRRWWEAVQTVELNGLSRANPKHHASRGDGEPSVIKGNHMSVW